MKNVFLPLVFFLGCLCACKDRSKKHIKAGELTLQEVKQDSVVKVGPTVLDSSLVSLKRFGAVSTEMMLSQLWIFEDADKDHWNEIFWDPLKDKRQNPEMALFSDHTVTSNARCGLETGKWTLNKDTRELTLQFRDGTSRTYYVRDLALRQLELGWKKDGGEAVIKLKSDGIVHKTKEEDPYYPANSLWRQKPAAAETKAQLAKRVRACVHFYALFFADNHNRDLTEISFDGLPSCFVWYNGGIGLQSKTELDKDWIGCFYSESQAYTAYDMIGDQLQKHELKWPEHPKSWVEQTGQVLGQLAEKF